MLVAHFRHYQAMVTLWQLNPRFPVVWQTPSTLQIGVSPARVILENIPDAALPLIDALVKGISNSGAAMLATRAGLHGDYLDSLMVRLTPVMAADETSPPTAIHVGGALRHQAYFTQVLANLGHPISPVEPDTDDLEGEIVLLANFVLSPSLYQRWLRQDRVHTAVIFSDQSITVGPRVIPGQTACLHCLFEWAQAAQPASAALASQLWGRISATDTAQLASLAAWGLRELLINPSPGAIITIDALSGSTTHSLAAPSPECSCWGFG
jgi:hypothetical protein